MWQTVCPFSSFTLKSLTFNILYNLGWFFCDDCVLFSLRIRARNSGTLSTLMHSVQNTLYFRSYWSNLEIHYNLYLGNRHFRTRGAGASAAILSQMNNQGHSKPTKKRSPELVMKLVSTKFVNYQARYYIYA